jgi:hypothetical protein
MNTELGTNNPLASYWLSAASTGFACPKSWKTWADTLIYRLAQPPLWIINMSLANTQDELYQSLQDRKRQEDYAAGEMIVFGNAKLGFNYLRYENGDFNLNEFLAIAGDEADSGTADLSCEIIFDILNTLELTQGDISTQETLARRVKEIFSPFKQIAEEQWAAIQSVISGDYPVPRTSDNRCG